MGELKMDMNNNEFQELRLKVDQISSELERQNIIRPLNTKWMIVVGTLIRVNLHSKNLKK